ncbi:hypothetical protein D1007_52130 [Hordeum vulgare]|nr:hypothetical protein D1007_52130 [Hordeum vulgare]
MAARWAADEFEEARVWLSGFEEAAGWRWKLWTTTGPRLPNLRRTAIVPWAYDTRARPLVRIDVGGWEIPDSIEDEDYRGLELDLMVFCRKHGKAIERFVAFEGTSTGRRFLACAEQGADNCGFFEWVDPYWPIPMQNALLKLWPKKLGQKSIWKMIKNVKCNHLKENERLIEERRKMKLQISQLQEVLANSEAEITDEVTKLKNELACMTLSNEKLTEEVATSSSWNQLLNEKMK